MLVMKLAYAESVYGCIYESIIGVGAEFLIGPSIELIISPCGIGEFTLISFLLLIIAMFKRRVSMAM